MSPPWDPTAPPVSPPRDLTAPPVTPPRDSTTPSVSSTRVLVMPAAAPAPAPGRRAVEPVFLRLVHVRPASHRDPHCPHRCCRFCQALRSTTQPVVLLSPTSTSCRAPTDLLS